MKFLVVLSLVCFNGLYAQDQNTTTSSTTESTTTTTTKPTTAPVTPAPTNKFYSIKSGNTTCIMIDGSFVLQITYDVGANKTKNVDYHVPRSSDDVNVKVDGSCQPDKHYINLRWGDTIPQSSFYMQFNLSEDGTKWSVKSLEIDAFLDEKTFVNASDTGKTLKSEINLGMTPSEVAVNNSYYCYTAAIATNISTTIDMQPYPFDVVLQMERVQIQAFNQIPNESDFVDGVHCQQDEIADVVPIAVGCALAALVLIVLIAYMIGRRRRASAYQSV